MPRFVLVRLALLVISVSFVSACQMMSGAALGPSGPAPTGSWSCSNGARLDIARADGGITVADSRGATVSLSPDPPGQTERYAAPGHALVIAGRTASWFASGRQPSDCRR